MYKIVDGAFYRQVNGGGRITDVRYFVRNRDISEVDKFMSWIEKITALAAHKFSMREINDDGNRKHVYSDQEYLLDLADQVTLI